MDSVVSTALIHVYEKRSAVVDYSRGCPWQNIHHNNVIKDYLKPVARMRYHIKRFQDGLKRLAQDGPETADLHRTSIPQHHVNIVSGMSGNYSLKLGSVISWRFF